ncbi:unnamed protein product [Diamesa serratosioi]
MKLGNKRIDEATLQKLKADYNKNDKQTTTSSITKCTKIDSNTSSKTKLNNSPFVRSQTRPSRMSNTIKTDTQRSPQANGSKRASEQLENEPVKKKLKLSHHQPEPVAKQQSEVIFKQKYFPKSPQLAAPKKTTVLKPVSRPEPLQTQQQKPLLTHEYFPK